MLRTFSFSLVLALCLAIALPTPSYAIRMVDDYEGGGGRAGGGGGQVTPPTDPEPTPQPEEPAPEEPTDNNGGIGGIGGIIETPVEALGNFVKNVTKIATQTVEQITSQLVALSTGNGGRLNIDVSDVLINQHGECRWLDNTGSADIFVPYESETEWLSFINNAPASVTRATCCPAATLNLTALDGQFLEINLPIGREGSTSQSGQRSFSQEFLLTRLDGGVIRETVNNTFRCQGGAWSLSDSSSDTVVVSDPEDPVLPEDPVVGPTCDGVPTEYEDVTATWTGSWRRSASSNTTYSSNGFTGVRHAYMNDGVFTSNGSGNRSTAVFTLDRPAVGHVKVTAYYRAYNGGNADGTPGRFSDGVTPKVSEFDIASGGVITAANTPQTLTFHSPHRMGHPFRMTNDIVFMPSYDSSPNLYSLTVEYRSPKPCNLPTDTIVFGSNCANTGGATTCISNGTSCVAPAGAMNAASQTGTFCSSVSSTDSGGDGATVTFDLRDQLSGRTGSAMIVIPYDPWVGLRDLTKARDVMANPDSYFSTPALPAPNGGVQEVAIKFMIPDVRANASSVLTQNLNSGCGKDCSNNHSYNIQYTASTKQLTVLMYKSGRWKKEWSKGHFISGECITGGAWNQQYRAGTCNGKVWSEVRVVAPAPATCGSAVTQTHTSYGMSGELCAGGTASEVSQTHDTIGNAPAGFYNWTCTSADTTATCQASYSDYIDFGGYIP